MQNYVMPDVEPKKGWDKISVHFHLLLFGDVLSIMITISLKMFIYGTILGLERTAYSRFFSSIL